MSEEVTAAIEALRDLEAIKALKVQYCRSLDAEDWTSLRAVLVSNAGLDADAFVAGVIRHHTDAEVVTVHQVFTPQLELTGPDSARGVWPMEDYIDRIWCDTGQREVFRGYGYYVETYRKIDGAWKISSTRHERTRIDRLEAERLPPFPHRGEAPTHLGREGNS